MYAQITQTGSLDLSGGSGNRAVLGGGASGTVRSFRDAIICPALKLTIRFREVETRSK